MYLENVEYRRSLREIYGVLNSLSKFEREIIPKALYEKIEKNMDYSYEFTMEENLPIEEQKLMPQTQALLIKIYEKYFATADEEDWWKRYDKLCREREELEKKKDYANTSEIYIKPKEIYEESVATEKEETSLVQVSFTPAKIWKNIRDFVKKIFSKWI